MWKTSASLLAVWGLKKMIFKKTQPATGFTWATITNLFTEQNAIDEKISTALKKIGLGVVLIGASVGLSWLARTKKKEYDQENALHEKRKDVIQVLEQDPISLESG